YTCRAVRTAGTTRYCFGDDPWELGRYAYYDRNSDTQTHPVGERQPNAWGLYDMHGNVWEWCWDRYDEAYYKQKFDKDPVGPNSGDRRVLRGGAWYNEAKLLRSACRSKFDCEHGHSSIGFRPARYC